MRRDIWRNPLVTLVDWLVPILSSWLVLTRERPEVFFHSDMLVLPSIYRDLFVDGYSIAGWSFTPAPYFFPDMPLYFLLEGVTGNTALALGLYGMVQVILFVLGVRVLLRAFAVEKYLPLPGFVTGILIFLSIQIKPLVIFLLPSAHFSSFLVGIFLFALLYRAMETGRGNRLLSFLIVLMIGSDRIFLLHFGLPALVLTFLSLRREPVGARKTLRYLGAGMVLGLVGYGILKNVLYIERAGRIPLLTSLSTFGRDMGFLLADSIVFKLLILSWFLSVVGALFLYFRRGREPAFLSLFVFLVFTGLVPPLVGSYMDLYSSRYNIYVLIVSVLFLFALAGSYARPAWRVPLWSGVMILWFAMGAIVYRMEPFRALAEYRSELVDCLDNRFSDSEVRMGLADYWNAKRITIFSKKGLRAYHVDYTSLQPSFTLSNRNWFACSGDRCPEFRFVVATHLDQGRWVKLHGEPTERIACGDDLIFLYPEIRLDAPHPASK